MFRIKVPDEIRTALISIDKALASIQAKKATPTKITVTWDDSKIASLHTELQGLRHEISGLRDAVSALRDQVIQPHTAASVTETPAASPSVAEPADQRDYDNLLGAAAGISYAELTCHRDTWAFIVQQAGSNKHFSLTVDIDEDEEGTIDAGISGRTLIAILDSLWNTRTDPDASTRSLAGTVYQRIRHALTRPENGAHCDGDSIRIIIDDRTPKPNKPDQPPADTTEIDDQSPDETGRDGDDEAGPDTTGA